MYLCDKDIIARLTEMAVECDDPSGSFSPESQVQPCSIDLRLSNVFWEPQKGRPVDLRKSSLLELKPRRYWRRIVLRPTEHITLKPGRLLLGRVCEKFTVPRDCAGKIEGRSSFSRLGVGIHCTGDFINPGYRGHMPLELVNYSPNPIRIFPFVPICQVMLVPLSGLPERRYGEKELQSKYMDDDGGPSYWWRDKRIRTLQKAFHNAQVELHVQEEVLAAVGIQQPEVIERFEGLVVRLDDVHKENAASLVERFAVSEDRLRMRHNVDRCFGKLLLPASLAAALGQRFLPFTTSHWALWVSVISSIWPFLWAWNDNPRQYLGRSELEAISEE
jgi:deoxycytidine triphosphate deaminase